LDAERTTQRPKVTGEYCERARGKGALGKFTRFFFVLFNKAMLSFEFRKSINHKREGKSVLFQTCAPTPVKREPYKGEIITLKSSAGTRMQAYS
jgi:hypothetical protein